MNFGNILSKRNRILLYELVVTDFKLRYQGSALGYTWSLLKPMMLFAIMYVVFAEFFKLKGQIPHFPVYLLLGIVVWTFFIEATSQGMQAIVSRGDLIRKINFPKYIIVISGTISALINLGINLIVVALFALVGGVDIGWGIALFPFFLLELYILSLGIAFLLAAVYVKFRDIGHIWEVFMQGMFYATPIIYPMSMVIDINPLIAKIMLLSPVAQIIQDMRYIAVTPTTTTITELASGNVMLMATPYIITILIAVIATRYFKRSQKYFAENV